MKWTLLWQAWEGNGREKSNWHVLYTWTMLAEMSWGLFLQWSRRSTTPSIRAWNSLAVRSLLSSLSCSISSTVRSDVCRTVWRGKMRTSEPDLELENKNKVKSFGDNNLLHSSAPPARFYWGRDTKSLPHAMTNKTGVFSTLHQKANFPGTPPNHCS